MKNLRPYIAIFTLILFISIIHSNALGNEQALSGLLPGGPGLTGYKTETGPEIYDSTNLFDMINGEAEVFLEYGFNEVIVQRYQSVKTGNTILIEIYKMKDMDGAFGLLTLYSNGRFTLHKNKYFSMSGEDYQYLQTGNYFISVTESGPFPGLFNEEIEELVEIILSKLNFDTGYPGLITKTETLCKNSKKILFFMGDLALSDAIYLGVKRPFQYTQGVFYNCGESDIIVFKSGQNNNLKQILQKTLDQFEKDGGYKITKNPEYMILQSANNETYKFYINNDNLFILEKRY